MPASRTTLLTPRLRLEPLAGRHAAGLFPALSDRRLYRYIPRKPPGSPALLAAEFRRRRRGDPSGRALWLNWAVRLRRGRRKGARRRGGALVGRLEATVRGRAAELAYLIGRRFQGNGYAREGCERVLESLFEDHQVGRVRAEMDAGNRASERLARALGFRRTARRDGELRYELRRGPALSYRLACAHDRRGEEREAIPHYERAIRGGLPGPELEGAYLGLGSSLRCVGEPGRAVAILRKGATRFPRSRSLRVFLALARHSLGQHGRALGMLLRELAQTSADPGVRAYRRALLFYAQELGRERPTDRDGWRR